MARDEVDEIAAKELYLFAKNDGDLYRQQGEPIIRNLMRKRAAGVYDHQKAAKLYGYLAENASRKYETGQAGRFVAGRWKQNPIPTYFNKATRDRAVEMLRDDFEVEANTGAYDVYVPKKYRARGSPSPELRRREVHVKPHRRR